MKPREFSLGPPKPSIIRQLALDILGTLGSGLEEMAEVLLADGAVLPALRLVEEGCSAKSPLRLVVKGSLIRVELSLRRALSFVVCLEFRGSQVANEGL